MLKNYKYFRVKKSTKNNGETIFTTEARVKWYHDWESFTKENLTLAESLHQIETIHNHGVVNIQIVHKKEFKWKRYTNLMEFGLSW